MQASGLLAHSRPYRIDNRSNVSHAPANDHVPVANRPDGELCQTSFGKLSLDLAGLKRCQQRVEEIPLEHFGLCGHISSTKTLGIFPARWPAQIHDKHWRSGS